MDVLVNNDFLNNKDIVCEALKQFKETYDWAGDSGVKLYRLSNINPKEIYNNNELYKKIVIPLSLFFRMNIIENKGCNIGINDINQQVSQLMLENLRVAISNDIRYILSIACRDVEKLYSFKNISAEIYNIQSKRELEEKSINEISAKSMKEVFDTIHEKYEEVFFVANAYKTAVDREDVYQQFGYSRLIKLFKVAHEILFPYILGKTEHISEETVFENFKKASGGIEVSRETTQTMQQFGKQREFTVDGEKIIAEIHIKIKDARIYLVEHKGKIYVTYAGKHLRTASRH